MSTQSVTQEVNGQVEVPQQQQIQEPKKATSIFEHSYMLEINRKFPGTAKKVDSSLIQILGETELNQTDRRKISSSKTLFDFPELRRVFSFDNEVDDFLDHKCVPFPLKRAIHLVPADSFDEVENFLTEHAARLPAFVEAAGNAYEGAIETAKGFLGPLFRQSDYLTKEAFKASFEFSWLYWEMTVSDRLKQMRADIAARESAKIEARVEEASVVMQQMLRASMSDLVTHLCDRLTPDSTGRKKIFKDAMLTNVQEFLTSFHARNLTADADLANLVERAKLLMSGVAPADLRDNEALRTTVQQGFTEIKNQLATMIESVPSREVRLVD